MPWEIPPSAEIGPGLIIMHGSGIVVHPTARLGSDCVIFQRATIGAAVDSGPSQAIGDGAKIGANAIVMRDVAPGETVRAGSVLRRA